MYWLHAADEPTDALLGNPTLTTSVVMTTHNLFTNKARTLAVLFQSALQTAAVGWEYGQFGARAREGIETFE